MPMRQLALLVLLAAPFPGPRAPGVPPEDAVTGILRVLDSVPLVAIMEEHLLAEEGELYVRLLRDPRAPGRINDVILELGNQLHQRLADRYVGWAEGEPVPPDSAFLILHDNTQLGLMTMYAPMYQLTLDAVREANARVPRSRRMRVLLGDPPVDWRVVTREALWELHKRRGDLMRELARDSVVAKGRRGVLIAGGSHLIRRPRSGGPGTRQDAKWGDLADKLFVVEVHTGFGAALAHLERPIDSLPRFTMLRTAEPPLRDVLYDDVKDATPAADGTHPPPSVPPAGSRSANAGVRLRELADGYVYLGPFRTLTISVPDAQPLRNNPARLARLLRAGCMMLGRADTTRMFRAPPSRLFFQRGQRSSADDYVSVDAPLRDERAGPPPLPAMLPEPCQSLRSRP